MTVRTEQSDTVNDGLASTPASRPEIVMLCDVDLNLSDGTRTHTVEVAKAFALEGFYVRLVARGPDPRVPGVAYSAALGDEHQRLRRLVTLNIRTISLLIRQRRRSRRFYVRDNWSCVVPILAARGLGYRIVVQVDGIPYSHDLKDPANLVKRSIAVIISHVAQRQLAVTDEIKDQVVELTRVRADRVEVIPNGVDLDFFTPIQRDVAIERLGLDARRRYLVFCGGLYPWSDFLGLLDAYAAVRAEQPDVRLILVGDGPAREEIEERAAELGLGEDLTLTGMIPEREIVRDYLAAASVTLLAYNAQIVAKTSASPLKHAEYLAAGRPVVGVEIPGIRELVVDSGAGLLVQDSTSLMAPAILEILGDGSLEARGAAARRIAEARLSWHAAIRRILALFSPVD